MRSTLPRLALWDAKMTAGTPRARAAYATPCPKLPAETATTARPGPILPSPASAWTTTHVPRPLNERIGLRVSTLTMTGTRRRRDRPSWTYCGEWVKAGSIRSWASRIASAVSSGIVDQRGRRSWREGLRIRRKRETPEGTQNPQSFPPMQAPARPLLVLRPFRQGLRYPARPADGKGLIHEFPGSSWLPARVVHTMSTKGRLGERGGGPAGMKTPEGTAITSCSNPCKQRSDHEMFAAPSGRTTIRRGSRRRHTADGPIVTTALRRAESRIRSTSSGLVSPSARTGKPPASISNG